MSKDRISVEIPQADKDKITQAAQTFINQIIAILIALPPEDKQALFKMSDRSIAFVEKTLEYMKTDPDFIPRYIDALEADKDFDLYSYLRSLLRLVEPLMKNINDTATLAGSDVMRAVNAYYGSVREAAELGVPRAQTIYEDLSQRYEAQKSRIIRPEPNP